MWIMIALSIKIKTDPLFNEILVKFTYLVGIVPGKKIYDMCYTFFILRLKAEVFQSRTLTTAEGENWAYGPTLHIDNFTT